MVATTCWDKESLAFSSKTDFLLIFAPMLVITKMSGTSGCYDNFTTKYHFFPV